MRLKYETRNSKSATRVLVPDTKLQMENARNTMGQLVLVIGILYCRFVSDFDIRISDFYRYWWAGTRKLSGPTLRSKAALASCVCLAVTSGMAADPLPTSPYAAPAPQKVKPERAKPATKRESLLGTIVNALGGDDRNNRDPGVRAIEDQNIRNLEAQFRPQFQQLLYVELAFLRRVCKPDAKPFAEVAKAAKAGLHVPLREYVVSRYGARRRGRGDSNAVDPRSEMQKLLMPLVEADLGPEKSRLYRQECDSRAEARKHAVVLNVVAALDERLLLTAQQRAKLVQSLSSNYERAWDPLLEGFAWGNQGYVPSIRDESLVPLLDERQKGVWDQTVKQNGQVFVGRVFGDLLGGDAAEIQEIARIAEEVQDGR